MILFVFFETSFTRTHPKFIWSVEWMRPRKIQHDEEHNCFRVQKRNLGNNENEQILPVSTVQRSVYKLLCCDIILFVLLRMKKKPRRDNDYYDLDINIDGRALSCYERKETKEYDKIRRKQAFSIAEIKHRIYQSQIKLKKKTTTIFVCFYLYFCTVFLFNYSICVSVFICAFVFVCVLDLLTDFESVGLSRFT